MKSPCILAAVGLASMSLAASEQAKAPPPSSKAMPPPAVLAVPYRSDLKITFKPHNGYGLLFDFVIENVGNLKSKETDIQFWVRPPCPRPDVQASLGSGKLIKSGKVKALVVTTSPNYAFHYSFEIPAPMLGCAIKAVVDPSHTLLESNENNNEVTVQTALPPVADLVVTYWNGQFKVKNIGNAAAGASTARVECASNQQSHPCDPQGGSSQKTWNYNVPALSPGQAHTFGSPLADQYAQFLHVVADAQNQVPELNKGNNTWWGSH